MREDEGMQSESSSIDPRYRPEFQRGFSGVSAPPVTPTPREEEPVRIGAPPARPIDAASEVVADTTPDAPPQKSRLNPYLFVIPVVAVGALVLGAWMLVSQFVWSYSGAFGDGNSVERRFGGVLAYVFAAPLVTVGVATLVGYLFWLAKRRP
jgi:hypothetical protein